MQRFLNTLYIRGIGKASGAHNLKGELPQTVTTSCVSHQNTLVKARKMCYNITTPEYR